MSALSLAPLDLRRDPTILSTLHAVQSALPSQLEAITTLATSGDWRAVRLMLNGIDAMKEILPNCFRMLAHVCFYVGIPKPSVDSRANSSLLTFTVLS